MQSVTTQDGVGGTLLVRRVGWEVVVLVIATD